jgi:hypothetical protein
MTDQQPADRRRDTDPELTDAGDVDAGAFIGSEAELTRADIPDSADPPPVVIPDPGWAKPPEGHRQGERVDDDDLKRKG